VAKVAGTITQVIHDLNVKYPGAIRLGTDESLKIQRIPTGVIAVDVLLGGGIACERYTEIYGQYSVLKSVLCLIAAAQFLEHFEDRKIALVDAEGSFDSHWAQKFGVDLDRMDVIRPNTGEWLTGILDKIIPTEEYSLIIIDSVAALTPQRELEYEAEEVEKAMGASGRMTSSMMRRITRLLSKHHTTIIIVNQMRDSLGGFTFGDPSKPTGGRAIPYYAGQRIECRRGEQVTKEVTITGPGGKQLKRKRVVGRVINLRMEKDKTGSRESTTAALLWHNDTGQIDEEESLLILGMEHRFVSRAAASITLFPNSSKNRHGVNGWDNAKVFLRENPKVARRLRRLILERELGDTASDN
jgi:recombination protein RecA